MARYTYTFGMKTRAAAAEILEEAYAAGEVSRGEFPQIESYTVTKLGGKKVTRYQITCEG